MQKLEDFLFDFIGIFIPGFFLVACTWISIATFLNEQVYKKFIDYISNNNLILFNGDFFFINEIIKQKPLVYLVFIIVCYLIGHLLSSISLVYMKKYKADIAIYNENIHMIVEVEKYLTDKYGVQCSELKERNKWIAYYRLANLNASSKEERSSLQIMLSRIMFFRSISLSFLVLACVPILILLISAIMIGLNFMNVGYIIGIVIFILICSIATRYFMKSSINTQKILCNESVLILMKSSRKEQGNVH